LEVGAAKPAVAGRKNLLGEPYPVRILRGKHIRLGRIREAMFMSLLNDLSATTLAVGRFKHVNCAIEVFPAHAPKGRPAKVARSRQCRSERGSSRRGGSMRQCCGINGRVSSGKDIRLFQLFPY